MKQLSKKKNKNKIIRKKQLGVIILIISFFFILILNSSFTSGSDVFNPYVYKPYQVSPMFTYTFEFDYFNSYLDRLYQMSSVFTYPQYQLNDYLNDIMSYNLPFNYKTPFLIQKDYPHIFQSYPSGSYYDWCYVGYRKSPVVEKESYVPKSDFIVSEDSDIKIKVKETLYSALILNEGPEIISVFSEDLGQTLGFLTPGTSCYFGDVSGILTINAELDGLATGTYEIFTQGTINRYPRVTAHFEPDGIWRLLYKKIPENKPKAEINNFALGNSYLSKSPVDISFSEGGEIAASINPGDKISLAFNEMREIWVQARFEDAFCELLLSTQCCFKGKVTLREKDTGNEIHRGEGEICINKKIKNEGPDKVEIWVKYKDSNTNEDKEEKVGEYDKGESVVLKTKFKKIYVKKPDENGTAIVTWEDIVEEENVSETEHNFGEGTSSRVFFSTGEKCYYILIENTCNTPILYNVKPLMDVTSVILPGDSMTFECNITSIRVFVEAGGGTLKIKVMEKK